MKEELKKEYKDRIVEAIHNNSFKFTTNKAQAVSLGVHPAQFSRIINDDIGNVVSDDKWREIANKYNVPKNVEDFVWKTGFTAMYDYIYEQLTTCQQMGLSGIFCDLADIGKSYTAKDYVSKHRNAVRVDCSLNKSRTELIRAVAREFGIEQGGSIRILQRDLISYINRLSTPPLVILDEFGDLSYPGLLETKALWNGTEGKCAWYMMGADGLQKKLDLGRENKKVGFAELFRRFGSRYQRRTPINKDERQNFMMHEISKILIANESKYTPLQMYAKTGGSLTRVYFEIKKEKTGIGMQPAN